MAAALPRDGEPPSWLPRQWNAPAIDWDRPRRKWFRAGRKKTSRRRLGGVRRLTGLAGSGCKKIPSRGGDVKERDAVLRPGTALSERLPIRIGFRGPVGRRASLRAGRLPAFHGNVTAGRIGQCANPA